MGLLKLRIFLYLDCTPTLSQNLVTFALGRALFIYKKFIKMHSIKLELSQTRTNTQTNEHT